jgi:sugar phosphate isomerase/epimerase
VRLGLSEISTLDASFEEDVVAYAGAGFDAIGIWEFKLPSDDDANRALLAKHGLSVANCVPVIPSFLPLGIPGMEGPADPEARLDALCASVHRLAGYEPESIVCLSGPLGTRPEAAARQIVLEGLQEVAAAARASDVPVGFEPVHPAQRDVVSFVNSIADAVGMLDEAGLDDVGLLLDLYHVADDPDVWDFIGRASYRVVGVHVADWPLEDARIDRELPGLGRAGTKELVDALALSGWDGTLDVEIFSEPERFWSLPVHEAAVRAHRAAAALS